MDDERHQNPRTQRQGPNRSGDSSDSTEGSSAARDGVRMGYDVINRHTQEGRDEAWRRAQGPGSSAGGSTGWPPGFGGLGGLGGNGSPWGMPNLGNLGALLGPWLWLLQMPARMFENGFGGRGAPPPTGAWGPFMQGVSRPPPGQPASSSPPGASSTQTPGAQQWAHGSFTPAGASAEASASTHAPASPASPASSTPRTVSVSVTSRRPTKVDVALPALASGTEVRVMPLSAIDADHPPLPEARLHAQDGRLDVGIIVPDEQPTGRYAAVVLHGGDGTVLGAISVDVSAS